jgi:hypothetical protein
MIRLSGGGRGVPGHAVALFRRHDSYVVFDSNFGAYRFGDSEQAARFFVRLWDEIYRARNGLGWIEGAHELSFGACRARSRDAASELCGFSEPRKRVFRPIDRRIERGLA